jgi:hypothetical protein
VTILLVLLVKMGGAEKFQPALTVFPRAALSKVDLGMSRTSVYIGEVVRPGVESAMSIIPLV